MAAAEGGRRGRTQRFAEEEEPQTSDRLWCEEFADMSLAGTHPVMYPVGVECFTCTPENLTGLRDRMKDHYEILELPVPERAVEQAQAVCEESGVPYDVVQAAVDLVYIYTLEEPPVYRHLNGTLASDSYWKEMNNKYVPQPDETIERDELMRWYAIALVDSLFILAYLGFVPCTGATAGRFGTKAPGDLWRGMPISQEQNQDQQYMRSRWTTFVSTSRARSVAEEFKLENGGVYQVSMTSYHMHPVYFDISGLSRYPEEEEWLILPGVNRGSMMWGSNPAIHGKQWLWTIRMLKSIQDPEKKDWTPEKKAEIGGRSKCIIA